MNSALKQIREQFPALERRIGDHPVAYFDGPGGTQVPTAVVAAVADYLLHHNANTHWPYPSSQETDALLLEARRAAADLVGGRPDEIAFGANMTTLTLHLSRAFSADWGPGDEILLTELDHHANIDPWRRAARDSGATVRMAPLNAECTALDLDALLALISPRTRLVAVGAASNALGTVTDVSAIARAAHAVGAIVYVDAVHYVPHFLADVAAFDCDVLVCSAYKFYGPHVGIAWIRGDLAAELDVAKLAPAADTPPERLETGTLNHEGIVGAAAAIDFLAGVAPAGATRRARLQASLEALHASSMALCTRLWEGLGSVPGVHRYGLPPTAARTPTVSFSLDGADAATVARSLAADGVFVSSGDFYASTVVSRLGRTDGLVRAGCACYTTVADVDRLLAGVRRAVRGRS